MTSAILRTQSGVTCTLQLIWSTTIHVHKLEKLLNWFGMPLKIHQFGLKVKILPSVMCTSTSRQSLRLSVALASVTSTMMKLTVQYMSTVKIVNKTLFSVKNTLEEPKKTAHHTSIQLLQMVVITLPQTNAP